MELFLDPNTSPNPGEIYLYWDLGSYNAPAYGTTYLPNNTQQNQ